MNEFTGILEFKSTENLGRFSGLLASYGNKDSGGDVIVKGAFADSLKKSDKCILCWQHDRSLPIGMLELKDSDGGLSVEGELNLELIAAKDAYAILKFNQERNIPMGLSIGYKVIQFERKDGARYLTQVDLKEGSIVTIPMNPNTLISEVKHEGKAEFLDALEQIQTWAMRYQLLNALDRSLQDVFYGSDSKEDRIAAVTRILDEFRTAFLDWLPKALDAWGIKEFPGLEIKAGASLSAQNRTKIQSVIDTLTGMLTVGTKADAGETAVTPLVERIREFDFSLEKKGN